MAPLSVITLTCNRLARLQRCLERLMPQLAPGDEVLLIDTGSTDGTREFYRDQAPERVRLVALDAPDAAGSWAEARNFGVRQARGELIAFLDDDCMVAPDWIARGRAGLADADAVGGMVRLHGIKALPRWWRPEMGWMVGLSVPGHAGPDAGRVHYPMTSNLWARAAACRAVPFQEIGGRLEGSGSVGVAEKYAAGREDAQWWRALRTGGWRARFDPLLWVGHALDPHRFDLGYLAERARMDGRAWAIREGTEADRLPTAYQWWDRFVRQFAALRRIWAEGTGDFHLHRLERQRQGRALRTLAEKLGATMTPAPLQPVFWQAGALYATDRAKTAVRRALHPLLVSRPDAGDEARLERLAVVAFGYVGDLVILQAALRGLVRAYPKLTVHVIGPPPARLALSQVQRVVVSTPPNLDPRSTDAAQWLGMWLRDVQADAIVAPYLHGDWGRNLAALRRPPRPVTGFANDTGLTRMRHLERISVRVHKDLRHHELTNLCHLLATVGLRCDPLPATLEPDQKSVAAAREDAIFTPSAHGGGPLVMFNPDAGHVQKEWTAEKWAALTRRALDETAWRIVFNASRPRPDLEERVEALSPAGRVHWLRAAPLDGLVAWLSLCRALATVDAGPQHLAHALGVPSVTLYGPMDERRWRDFWNRPIHRTLRACAWDLTPEERRGFPENHITALIDPAEVFQQLKIVLSGDAA
jgi:ADP-heptose:LPS heptosyltransferase